MSLNQHQFKAHMSGVEWQAAVTHSTDGPMPDMWKEKTDQARQTGLTASMSEHGYVHDPSDPPTIVLEHSPSGKTVRAVQSEGHKRVAAAADIERTTGKPVMIPTRIVDNTRRSRG